MEQEWEYVGFWARAVATAIDLILQLIVTAPLVMLVYGQYSSPGGQMFQGAADVLITGVLPVVAVIAFWTWKGATPGKLAMSARIVDAETGEPPSTGQAVVRYLGYIVSMLALGIGFLWIAIDRRKQGWHDKMAGTVVIRPAGAARVTFPRRTEALKPTPPRP